MFATPLINSNSWWLLLALGLQLACWASCPADLCPPRTSVMCLNAASTLASCSRHLCGCLAEGAGSFSYAGRTEQEELGAFLALELGDGQGVETRVQVSAGCDVHLLFFVGTKLTNLTQEMILLQQELNFTLDLGAWIGMCSDGILDILADNVTDALDNPYSRSAEKYPHISEYMFDDYGPPNDVILRHRWAHPCPETATPGSAYLLIMYNTYRAYSGSGNCLRIDIPSPSGSSAECAAPVQNFSKHVWGRGYEVYTGCNRNWTSPLRDDSSSLSDSSSSGNSSSSSDSSSSSSIFGEVFPPGCPPDLCPSGTEAFCFQPATPLANCSLLECGCLARAAGSFAFRNSEASVFGVVALMLMRGQWAETRLTISRGCDVGVRLSVEQLKLNNSGDDAGAHVGLCSDGLSIASEYVLEAINNSYSPGYTAGKAPARDYIFEDGGPVHQVVLRHRWSRPCTGGVDDPMFAYLVVRYSSVLPYNGTGDCLRLDISNPFELYARSTTGASKFCNCQGAQACAAPTLNFSAPARGLGYELYEGCENRWREAFVTTTTPPATTTAPSHGSTLPPAQTTPPALSSAVQSSAGVCWVWLLILAVLSLAI